MEPLRNFLEVTPGLATAGQPAEGQFVEVARRGVRLVVNLALPTSDFALPNERRTVEDLGMEYVAIPVPFDAPTVDHFLTFERALRARPDVPTLVHCAMNWRGTSFAALFAERNLGWSRARADDFRRRFWSPNDVWDAWAAAVRGA